MNEFVVRTDKLKLLKEENGERYYVFYPRFFRVYPKSGNMRRIGFKEFLLHRIRAIHGYKVYIMTDTSDRVKGSIEISKGGSYRYPFATKNDLIDGPDYTVPEFRGQGVAVRLGNNILHMFEKNYKTVYATVEENNSSSLRRVEKNGFVIEARLKADLIRRFKKDDSGHIILVAYRKP